MKPRLLICTQTAHILGGFQLWLDKLCHHLPSLGWEVVVGFAQGKTFHHPAKFRAVYSHMEGVIIDGRDGTVEGRLLAIEKTCQKIKPHIVIPALLADVNYALCRLKRRGSNIRYLYTCHGTHDWNIAEPERYASFVDMFCSCTDLSTQTLLRRGRFPKERLASVANGVPHSAPPAARPLDPGTIQLAYAGRIDHPDKRVLDIPRILDRLNSQNIKFHLRVAGSGPEEGELRRQLEPYAQAGSVEHFGRLHFDDLKEKIYSKTDILLFPSPWEGWPLVVGEALSAGIVPAAAAFRGVAAENVLIPDGNSVIFQVGDCNRAGDLIADLARCPEKLKRLSNQAYVTSQSFTWERCASDWSAVLNHTLELPVVCGEQLPPRLAAGESRLSRLGVPISAQVALRSVTGRQYPHDSSNSEWPYRDKDFDLEQLSQMEADLLRIEQQAITRWPEPYCNIRSLTRAESQ